MVGRNAIIGDDTIIRHHATVEGKVVLGKANEIYPYSLIGGLTHDLKFSGGEPALHIGDRNTFREYCTAHVATSDQNKTLIGSDNTFLAYSHVAHDCIVGDNLIMSSHSALGGHVIVADHVNIGWGVGCINFVVWVEIVWFQPVQNWCRMLLLICLPTVPQQKFDRLTKWAWKETVLQKSRSKWQREFLGRFTVEI